MNKKYNSNISILDIIRHKNNSPLSGIFSILIGLVCILSIYIDPTAKNALTFCAIIMFACGFIILVWSPKRVSKFNSISKIMTIQDSTRFSKSSRTIPFSSINSVFIKVREDKDPDTSPIVSKFYTVVIQLNTNEEIIVTDEIKNNNKAHDVKLKIESKISHPHT